MAPFSSVVLSNVIENVMEVKYRRSDSLSSFCKLLRIELHEYN